MTIGNFEISDAISAAKPAGEPLINSIDFQDAGAVSNDAGAGSLPDLSVSEPEPVSIQTIEPYFLGIGDVNITTAAENAASGAEPDYFIGEDGQLRQNPNKEVIAKDGNLNIQIEGGDGEAAKAANEAQKATVRELIRYFQKYNPGKPVPQEWTDKLHNEPDLPQSNRHVGPAPETPSYSSPSYSSGGSRRSSGGSSYRPSGGQRYSGGGNNSFRPSDGGQFSPEPIFPRGDIERHTPVAGDMRLEGPPTITAEKIDEVLKSYGSPATGLGQEIYDEGVKRGINPAVALAFFIQESSAGTAGVARSTKSWGNIKGSGPAGSYKGFRAYDTWEQGVQDWYRLIDDKYLAPPSEGGRGYETLSQVISTYAPSSDNNNEQAYVANVKGMVEGWARDTGQSHNLVA